MREPRRAAVGILFEMAGGSLPDEMKATSPGRSFAPRELRALATLLEKKLNAPVTSSAGRLFDAVASLAGLRQRAGFEGQAALDLEFALEGIETDLTYSFSILEGAALSAPGTRQQRVVGSRKQNAPPLIVDWQPMIEEILADVKNGVHVGAISAKFHNSLVEVIVSVARRSGEKRVVLTGGCFQNRYLTERAVNRLEAGGFQPFWHQRIPPNDGGIAVGQIAAAMLPRLNLKIASGRGGVREMTA